MDQLGGKRDMLVFPSRLSRDVQAEPVPDLEARVLYSLIIFQNYTAITFKIQSWGGFSGWDGRGQGNLGQMGRDRVGWRGRGVDFGKAHLTDLSDKHYKFNSYYYSFNEVWQEKRKEGDTCENGKKMLNDEM